MSHRSPVMSACGVLCSGCPANVARVEGPAYQRRAADAWRRIYGLNEKAEHISCGGCLAPDDEVFHTCRSCGARGCCRERGLNSCAECPDMPCALLERAQALWDGVPELARTLTGAEFEEFARPYCDHRARLAAARAARLRRLGGVET